MVAQSSEGESAPELVAESIGEAEITLEGGGCRVTVRGPERSDSATEWDKALRSGFEVWAEMERVAHASRIREIKAEQGGRPGPASAGFIQEGASEARNQTLPGGSGVRPV